MNKRLTWKEIKEKYPHRNVGLKDIIYKNQIGGSIESAIVICTDVETDINEMAYKAIKGELVMTYTTLDEDETLFIV